MIGLRVMESSERANSTTAERAPADFADWLLAAAVAVSILIATVGIDLRIGGMSIRAHDAWRSLMLVAVVAGIRLWIGVGAWPAWIIRMTLLTAIAGSIATWFRFLLATIGGADSWGYVSAAELIRRGHLVEPAPIANWLSASNRLAIASPLGWAPAPDGSGIVPTYPLGLPAVMALFSSIGGSHAVFFVAPAAALLTLLLVYRLAREWYDARTSLFAAAITSWNPVFIAYAKQPMSDVLATMWIVLGLWMSQRGSVATAVIAGAAAGVALATRPVLIVAGGVIVWLCRRGEAPLARMVAAGATFALCVVAQMALQNHLFGSPFSTGYGGAGNLFALAHLGDNLKIYGAQIWSALGLLWLVGLLIGVMAARPEPRSNPSLVFGAVALPYLFYLPFDHWETLRFLMPGLVPLSVLVADGWGHIGRLQKASAIAALIICSVMAITVWQSTSLLRHGSVWKVASLEARYPLAGDWVNVDTPSNAIVLANQHSGSLRWYGKRQTLRWDFIEPQQLTTTVRELQSHGATVYVALEGDEVQMFNTRFAGEMNLLQIDPVGHVRNVSFLRIK